MKKNNIFLNLDCLEGMKQYPNNYFDLAIVDPPYGGIVRKKKEIRYDHNRLPMPETGVDRMYTAKWFQKYTKGNICKHIELRDWDISPPMEYFQELMRVSRNQIIWGGNFFELPPTRCIIVWKKTNIPENFSMSALEFAWTSFNRKSRMFACSSAGTKKHPRFHPTQKPIKLYEWLLTTYAKSGDKILDTHVGSASSLIACERLGFEYTGFELNKEYYTLAQERLEAERTFKT